MSGRFVTGLEVGGTMGRSWSGWMSSIWASSMRRTRSVGSSSMRGTAWQSSRRHYRDGRLTASQARDQEDHEHLMESTSKRFKQRVSLIRITGKPVKLYADGLIVNYRES